MPLKTSIYISIDNLGLVDTIIKRAHLDQEGSYEISIRSNLSEPPQDAHVAVLFSSENCLGSASKKQLIASLANKVPLVVALSDYTEEKAKQYLDMNAKEVLPIKSISPKLFQYALHLHGNRKKKKETAPQSAVNQQLGALLDRIPFNLLMTDASGKVVFSNQGGSRFLDQQDGISVNENGVVTLSSPHENQLLLEKIRKIASGDEAESHNSSLRFLHEEEQIVIIVLPLKGSEGKIGTAVFLRNEKEEAHLNEGVLKSLYGLTGAETKLVLLLTNGYSLSEISEMNAVSQHTVRTQLKNIYAKTGMNRQTDLIKAIITGPASLRSI